MLHICIVFHGWLFLIAFYWLHVEYCYPLSFIKNKCKHISEQSGTCRINGLIHVFGAANILFSNEGFQFLRIFDLKDRTQKDMIQSFAISSLVLLFVVLCALSTVRSTIHEDHMNQSLHFRGTETCRRFVGRIRIFRLGCNAKIVRIPGCHGTCRSRSVPKWDVSDQNTRTIEFCTCCKPHHIGRRYVILTCPRLQRRLRFGLSYPLDCACRPCSDGETELDQPYDYDIWGTLEKTHTFTFRRWDKNEWYDGQANTRISPVVKTVSRQRYCSLNKSLIRMCIL